MFNLLNPNLRHPFHEDLESTSAAITPIEKLKYHLSKKKKPRFSEEYNHLQAADWLRLERVHHKCTV